MAVFFKLICQVDVSVLLMVSYLGVKGCIWDRMYLPLRASEGGSDKESSPCAVQIFDTIFIISVFQVSY